MSFLDHRIMHDGFIFIQVYRLGDFAIYEQRKDERLIGYEVIHVQKHKEHVWPTGQVTLAGEHYPSSRQWGTAGWTFKRIKDAYAKLLTLMQNTLHHEEMSHEYTDSAL